MSIEVMGAVWKLDLPKEQKFVLLAFADIANDAGYCWPSVARIAWKCGYSQRRRCAEVVRKLIDSGVLAVIEKPQGRRAAMYQVRTWVAASLPAFDPAAFDDRRGANLAPHANGDASNPLNPEGDSRGEKSSGANLAPEDRSGATLAPETPVDKSVAVPSPPRSRAISAQLSVPSPPLYSSYTHQEPLAPRDPARMPGSGAKAERDRELLALNNSAMLLGLYPKTENETLDDLRRRINRAHQRKLEAQIAHRRDEERRRVVAEQAEAATAAAAETESMAPVPEGADATQSDELVT